MPNEGLNKNAATNGGVSQTGLAETPPPTDDSVKNVPDKLAADRPAEGGGGEARSEPGGDGPAEGPDLLTLIQTRRGEYLNSLAQPSWMRKLWREFRESRSPEMLKAYGVIHTHLGEAQRLLTQGAAASQGGGDRDERQLRSLLAEHDERARSGNIHAAWEFAGALERALLPLGGDDYIRTRLEGERRREQEKVAGFWSTHLAAETLDTLLEQYKAEGVPARLRRQAVESLAFLSLRRSEFERTRRAREEIKSGYLNRLTIVLTVLLLLLVEVSYLATKEGEGAAAQLSRGFRETFWMVVTLDFRFDFASQHVKNALVAAMTGALGSTLSGFYKLRDERGGIATLRSFRSAMWAQPFVGAAVGVLLMLLIMSGVLAIGVGGNTKPALDWLPLAVYCFFAGFSEPFFLGVVQRVAGAADRKTGDAAGGGAAGNRGAASGGGAAGNAGG